MNDDNEIIWQKALEIAKSQVQESEFIMWFRLDYLGFENGTIRLRATNTFLRDQFVRKYSQFMKEIISSLLGMPVELSVESESVSKPIASVSATLPKRENSEKQKFYASTANRRRFYDRRTCLHEFTDAGTA